MLTVWNIKPPHMPIIFKRPILKGLSESPEDSSLQQSAVEDFSPPQSSDELDPFRMGLLKIECVSISKPKHTDRQGLSRWAKN